MFWLANSWLTWKKTDRSDYEPDSLTSFHRSIARYLQTIGYEYDIVKSSVFHTSKKVLEMGRRELKQSGKGNRPNRAESLSAEQEDRLWLTGQLGTGSVETVQNTQWYFVTKLLGFNSSHEARQLQWGDLKLREDENTAFLEFTERETKTRTGNSDPRPFAPKMFANLAEPSKCPVKMYKIDRANRPQNMSHEDSPFFLGINRNGKSFQWYRSQPMGHDTLGSIMKRMCVVAGLRGKHNNHSVRKTMMTNWVQANIDSNLICQLSGHKNVNSVNGYAVASKFQQKMCNVLQNPDESSNMLALPGPSREARVVPVSRGRSACTNVSNSTVVLSSYQVGLNKSSMFAGAVFNGPVHFHFHKH